MLSICATFCILTLQMPTAAVNLLCCSDAHIHRGYGHLICHISYKRTCRIDFGVCSRAAAWCAVRCMMPACTDDALSWFHVTVLTCIKTNISRFGVSMKCLNLDGCIYLAGTRSSGYPMHTLRNFLETNSHLRPANPCPEPKPQALLHYQPVYVALVFIDVWMRTRSNLRNVSCSQLSQVQLQGWLVP